MNKYIAEFKKALAEYEARCGCTEELNVLEILWYCYFQSVPVDDGLIKEKDAAINPIFDELSVESSDALNGLICDVCTAYQRAAFLDGIQVGYRLQAELGTDAG